MRTLYLDCTTGVHCNMIVGALCDLGLKPSALEWELSSIDLGDFHMHFDRQTRGEAEGIVFTLHVGSDHAHCDSETHTHGPGKTLSEILPLIVNSDLSPFVKEKATAIYETLAAAQAIRQETDPANARLRDAGTLEGIATALAACIGIEALGVQKICASPLREGSGWIQDATGQTTLPSPVTLAILRNIPLTQTGESLQLLPPFSAAVLAVLVEHFGDRPNFGSSSVGYGISPRRFPIHPSTLRAELGEVAEG